MKPVVLIPAHNEVPALARVVDEVRRCAPGLPVLVVDDASTDGTPWLLEGLGVRWLRLGERLGPGGAVRAGLRRALMLGFDTVLRLDADGQHPADQIARLLAALADADAAVGTHDATAPRSGPLRRVVRRLLSAALGLLLRRSVADATSGFWAFGERACRLLAEHHPSGYSEPELHLLLHRNGLRVAEVPLRMRGRLAGRTTLTPPRAGLAFARALLAMLVVPRRPAVDLPPARRPLPGPEAR